MNLIVKLLNNIVNEYSTFFVIVFSFFLGSLLDSMKRIAEVTVYPTCFDITSNQTKNNHHHRRHNSRSSSKFFWMELRWSVLICLFSYFKNSIQSLNFQLFLCKFFSWFIIWSGFEQKEEKQINGMEKEESKCKQCINIGRAVNEWNFSEFFFCFLSPESKHNNRHNNREKGEPKWWSSVVVFSALVFIILFKHLLLSTIPFTCDTLKSILRVVDRQRCAPSKFHNFQF